MRFLQVLLAAALLLLLAALPLGEPGVPTAHGQVTPTDARAPAAVTAAAELPGSEVQGLRTDIGGMLRSTGWRSSRWGILAVSLSWGDTLVAMDSDRPMIPASNQKLLTSAAALHYLGPDFRFPTYLLARGEVRAGVLEGDLILYGTGDPAISGRLLTSETAPFRAFAGALREQGIHQVRGEILGDGTFFQGHGRGAGWNPGSLNNAYAAPVSALSFNENVVTLRVRPSAPGAPVRVLTTPEGAGLPMDIRARSVPGRTASPLMVAREHPDGPIQILGELSQGSHDIWRVITVSDPPAYAASVLRHVLEEEGIRVTGGARSVSGAALSPVTGSRLWSPAVGNDRGSPSELLWTAAVHHSPPVRDLLRPVNTQSQNLITELLFFAMGRMLGGEGSFHGGAEALSRYLVEGVGVDRDAFHVEDGSGLSRANRITPGALVQLLTHMTEAEHSDLFWSSLPEAGNRRGLGRMYRSAAAGNLRAKTGTIRNVSALSGMVRTHDGEPILFSILANDVPSSWTAKGVEDRIGIRLASFGRSWQAPPGVEPLVGTATTPARR